MIWNLPKALLSVPVGLHEAALGPYDWASFAAQRTWQYATTPYSARLACGLSAACEERIDRKSTRLNSSHQIISYAVFCLKKKKMLLIDCTDLYEATTDA